MALIDINNLQLDFGEGASALTALDGVSLSIRAGETICLVGESGSGKTVTALSIARLLPSPPARYPQGQILLEGRDVLKMTQAELLSIRGGFVSYVFQEPGASLNPVFRIGRQIKEAIELHQPEVGADAEVIRLLKRVGIPAAETRQHSYPHELSGGMQQRVMIAMAIASRPKLLIADEPTTALDVTIQAQIIELLRDLKQQLGMALLLITHNLGIAADLADRLVVMYAGQIVEAGTTRDVLSNPLHPYTQALIHSVPRLGAANRQLHAIPGVVPRLDALPAGCRFSNRCRHAVVSCSVDAPALFEAREGHRVRCPFWQNLSQTAGAKEAE